MSKFREEKLVGDPNDRYKRVRIHLVLKENKTNIENDWEDDWFNTGRYLKNAKPKVQAP